MRHFQSTVSPEASQTGFIRDALHANALASQRVSRAHRARMRFEGQLVIGFMAVLYAAWIAAISTGLIDRLPPLGGGL